MKILNLKKGLFATVALGAFAVGTASAQVTAAETEVENTFTLNYEVNDTPQPPINNDDNPTTFLVDRLIDLTVENTGSSTSVAPGQIDAVTNFTLTNDGNGDQAYDLSVVSNSAEVTDDFNPTDPTGTLITYEQDRNGDGTVTTNIFVATDTSTFPILGPDEEIAITILQNIPTTEDDAGVIDGNEGQIILIADTLDSDDFSEETADDNTENALDESENILADGSSTGEEDENDGDDSAIGTYIVAEADVTGVKTVAIVAEDGGTAANCESLTTPTTVPNDQYSIPGACVEYVITVTNTDTRDATAIVVTDVLPSELTFVSAEASGFTPAGSFASLPGQGDDCDPTEDGCTVTLTGATLEAPSGGATSSVGTVTIRALLK